jgi:hypothetical protein
VALSGATRHGSESIRLISPSTGRLIKVLAKVGSGNGFALSPDSRNVFIVGPARDTIEIRRIAVSTGRISFEADGAYPAVSPDNRFLAYATGRRFREVAIRNLRTGSTRTVNLTSLIGKDSSLLNQGAVAWLGDGTEVIAVAQSETIAVASGSPSPSLMVPPCGPQDPAKGLCVIVIRIRPKGLSARPVFIPGQLPPVGSLISADLTGQRSFLIADTGGQSPGTVVRVTLRGTGVVTHQIGTLPAQVLPVALAPDGDRILYLVGHRPPALWVARLSGGRLAGAHRIMTDNNHFGLGEAAW